MERTTEADLITYVAVATGTHAAVALQLDCVCPHIASDPSEQQYNKTKPFIILGKLGLKMGAIPVESRPQTRMLMNRIVLLLSDVVLVLRSIDTVPVTRSCTLKYKQTWHDEGGSNKQHCDRPRPNPDDGLRIRGRGRCAPFIHPHTFNFGYTAQWDSYRTVTVTLAWPRILRFGLSPDLTVH